MACPGRDAAFFMPLRRTGTVTDAGVWYGPGSAVQREARRCFASPRLHRVRDTFYASQLQIRWTTQQSDPLIVAIGEAGAIRRPKAGVRPMWILLLLPFIGLLWVPFYNFLEPTLFGFPFFYWYQLAWVPISSLLIWLVYRSQKPDETS
jgi:hypothetical protein